MSKTTSTSQREDGSAEKVIALVGQDWVLEAGKGTVESTLPDGGEIRPFRAGETLAWRIV